MTCGRVVIINKGRVVAEDTPENLTHRLQGAATVRLEVRGEPPRLEATLAAVPGVKSVRLAKPGVYEVDAEGGRDVRARARARGRRPRPRPRRPAAVGHEPGGDLPASHDHRRRRRDPGRRDGRPPRRCARDRAPQRLGPGREGVAALFRQPHRLRGHLHVDASLRGVLRPRHQPLHDGVASRLASRRWAAGPS